MGPRAGVGAPLTKGMLQPVGFSARAGCAGVSNLPVPVAVCRRPCGLRSEPRASGGPASSPRTGRVGTSPLGHPEGARWGTAHRPHGRCRRADADVVSSSAPATLSAGPPAASPRGARSASSGRSSRSLRGALRAVGEPPAGSHHRHLRIRGPRDAPPDQAGWTGCPGPSMVIDDRTPRPGPHAAAASPPCAHLARHRRDSSGDIVVVVCAIRRRRAALPQGNTPPGTEVPSGCPRRPQPACGLQDRSTAAAPRAVARSARAVVPRPGLRPRRASHAPSRPASHRPDARASDQGPCVQERTTLRYADRSRQRGAHLGGRCHRLAPGSAPRPCTGRLPARCAHRGSDHLRRPAGIAAGG